MTLEEFATHVAELRTRALFGDGVESETETEGLDPFAEQEFLSALGLLELAACAARRACLHQARALAQSPYRQ